MPSAGPKRAARLLLIDSRILGMHLLIAVIEGKRSPSCGLHLHGLSVAGPAGAHGVVAGRLGLPLRVADRGLLDAGEALIGELKPPEAATGKGGELQTGGCRLWRQLRAHGGAEGGHDGGRRDGLQK